MDSFISKSINPQIRGDFGNVCWCFSPEEEERMAGDAGKALVKAVGASQKAGAVAIEVNSKDNSSIINIS